MKKSIADSRSAENVSDKKLRTEVQPAQTWAVYEKKKHFW